MARGSARFCVPTDRVREFRVRFRDATDRTAYRFRISFSMRPVVTMAGLPIISTVAVACAAAVVALRRTRMRPVVGAAPSTNRSDRRNAVIYDGV